MKVKNGDIIEFIAIEWQEKQWEFDHPTVVLIPKISYSPNGDSCENMIESMAINFSCGDDIEDEDITEEFEWRGWKLKTMHKVVKDRLNGLDTWCTKHARILKQKIEFYEENGELEYRILETFRKPNLVIG